MYIHEILGNPIFDEFILVIDIYMKYMTNMFVEVMCVRLMIKLLWMYSCMFTINVNEW